MKTNKKYGWLITLSNKISFHQVNTHQRVCTARLSCRLVWSTLLSDQPRPDSWMTSSSVRQQLIKTGFKKKFGWLTTLWNKILIYSPNTHSSKSLHFSPDWISSQHGCPCCPTNPPTQTGRWRHHRFIGGLWTRIKRKIWLTNNSLKHFFYRCHFFTLSESGSREGDQSLQKCTRPSQDHRESATHP